MKWIILISMPLLTLISEKTIAQEVIRITDTTMRVKIIDPDSTVVFARPRDSALFCRELTTAWSKYFYLHKEVKDQLYKNEDDEATYYSCLRIIIVSTGDYSILVNQKSNAVIDRSLKDAFGDLLKRTKWHPKAKKTTSGIRHVATHAFICFTILHEKVLAVKVEDLDSKYPIFHVNLSSNTSVH